MAASVDRRPDTTRTPVREPPAARIPRTGWGSDPPLPAVASLSDGSETPGGGTLGDRGGARGRLLRQRPPDAHGGAAERVYADEDALQVLAVELRTRTASHFANRMPAAPAGSSRAASALSSSGSASTVPSWSTI